MSGQTRVADDADAIKAAIDRLAHERLMAPKLAGCAVLRGEDKSTCDQCKGERCLLCKTYQPNNQDGAKGCILCDKGDGTFKPCPTST